MRETEMMQAGRCAIVVALAMALAGPGCWTSPESPGGDRERSNDTTTEVTSAMGADDSTAAQERAREFLDAYQKQLRELYVRATHAAWAAATTGETRYFDERAEADIALRRLHADPDRYAELRAILTSAERLDDGTRRAFEIAALDFRANQLPSDLIEDMARRSAQIEQKFNTFRGTVDGEARSNNELLRMLQDETDSARREEVWEALKQVGGAVAADLVELARVRNRAAAALGFEDFWDMKIRLQEHDPETLLAIFDELEQLTREPFLEVKATLDAELGRRFGVEPAELMPWHYDNPFFQAAPPSEAVDLDEFYEQKPKEEIVEIARRFYADIGLPIDGIIERSDLYEREGKDQHAFCEDMDREGDVRTLQNIRPTAEWMDTMLHECGHAVYDVGIDPDLPFNIRSANHIFTTEAVAMLFGALAKTPSWIVAYAGADPERVEEVDRAIREQRRREQLIFCRWTLVMLHFERALYGDPDQDLNQLWWDLVERFQSLRRPAGRDAADWAAKPHFTIAPVYYHNYQLGELFASQLRATLARRGGRGGRGGPPGAFFEGRSERSEIGEFLRDAVFRPGRSQPWPEFVRAVTGEGLTARHFASEVE